MPVEQPRLTPKDELLFIQQKYDGAGMPLAVYAVLQKLEREIAWGHHGRDQRLAG